MLTIHLKGVQLGADVDTGSLASLTSGYSGADLQLVCRDASMMPMRRAVEGKTPQEIVELHAEGALEAAVSAADFGVALQHTQPSVTPEETAAYAAFNREHGCSSTGAVAGPKLATPPRAAAPAAAPTAGRADARRSLLPPVDDEHEAAEGEQPQLIEDVC